MLTHDERNRRISEGLRLAWKRRKTVRGSARSARATQFGGGLSRKQLQKIALYLKYIAFILEEGTAA